MTAAPGLDPLYWDDLEPGLRYRTSSRTVTEADVVAFAGLTMDYNRLHVDAEYAAGTAFGRRIAHGMLVASLVTGLNTRTIENQRLEPHLLALLGTELRFPKPTFLGDTLHAEIEVVSRRPTSNPERGVVVFRRSGVNQHGETVCECATTVLVRRDPTRSPATTERSTR